MPLASLSAARAFVANSKTINTMTSDTITEYTVLDLRNQLRLTIEALDDLLRDIATSDETPEGAAERVATEVEKITALA